MTDVFVSEVEFELTAGEIFSSFIGLTLIVIQVLEMLDSFQHCCAFPRGWLRLFEDAQHVLF